MNHRRTANLAVAIVISLGAGVAFADAPIWTPVTIDSSGTYMVTRNISATTGPVIEIVPPAADVVIDVRGYRLSGSGDSVIHAVGIRSLTIRNGIIDAPLTLGGDGIHVEQVDSATINHMQIISMSNGLFLSDVDRFDIQECEIVRSEQVGISVDGTDETPVRGLIQGNTVRDSGSGGIVVSGNHASVHMMNNRVEAVTNGPGIHLLGGRSCFLRHNRVAQAGSHGIYLQLISNCELESNLATECHLDGVRLEASNHNTVEHNSSVLNDGNGVSVLGVDNEILNNRMNRNGLAGLWFESGAVDNFFQDNMARRNAASPGGCAASSCAGLAEPDFCDGGAENDSGLGNFMPGPPSC